MVPGARLGRAGLGAGDGAGGGTGGDAGALRPHLLRAAGGGGAVGLRTTAKLTDVLTKDNPGWQIELNDDVIGRWRGEDGSEGSVTLVWVSPLVRGAVAATAELELETVDQGVGPTNASP